MRTTELTLYCGDCHHEQAFERFHAVGCPDAPSGECPELSCTACGGALIAGLVGRKRGSGDGVSRAA